MQNEPVTSVPRKVLKRILYPFLTFYFKWYLKNKRRFKYKGVELTVLSGVFHPGFFLSSKILMRFLESLDIREKKLLELGAGSGAVGFYAEQLGAEVTLSDINNKAIEGLRQNANQLASKAEIVHSDLFETLHTSFDFIVINPPYYPKKANSEAEMAWYCGVEFEYFKKLFQQLTPKVEQGAQVYMILSEDCDMQQIQQIAADSNFQFQLTYKERRMWEWNYVFTIVLEK